MFPDFTKVHRLTTSFKQMSRLILCILVYVLSGLGCTSKKQIADPQANLNLFGIWCYIGKDSSYNEVIFTDSLLWNYDEAFGVIRWLYRIEGDSLKVFNLDGTDFRQFRISAKGDSLFLEPTRTVNGYRRMSMERDKLLRIVHGDEREVDEYWLNLIKRKNKWYLETYGK
jgi:hypothetical protein